MTIAYTIDDTLPAIGSHVVLRLRGDREGPLLVAVGGIHGNEPAGVHAMTRVARELASMGPRLRGDVLFLAGNTRALAANLRFVDVDLNRAWIAPKLDAAPNVAPAAEASEDLELHELRGELDAAIAAARGETYFVDLHTMSADGEPFATIGDTIRNRRFASAFPVPKVLGLEENIDGSLLEYLNGLGFVTLGVEAGRHDAPSSIAIHEAVLWTALVASGCLDEADAPRYLAAQGLLALAGDGGHFYEVRHRHGVRPGDEFVMEPGFANFAPIRRGQVLARDWRGEVRSPERGVVMLPLYQGLGDDGFFVGRRIKRFWLHLSAALRRVRADRALAALPGVRRKLDDPDTLLVNTRIARYFPMQVFHLFGYRRRRWTDEMLVVSRRKFDLAGPPSQNRAR